MSRGNERDLAQSLKKRCADKYIAMSRDIAFILLSPATSRTPSNLPNPTLNPSEPRQKMRATLDRAPLPETSRHRRVSTASCEIGRAVVEGQSVLVRVDVGGRRFIKKKTTQYNIS